MATPYLSRRTGSNQWLMQRVSAFLLVGLAFTHFAIQHFTSDAVSTGLTVAARLNNPWWQAYYVVFIALALYHGVNGVVGIIRDYNPRPSLSLWIELVIWSAAALFAARGIVNIASPVPLSAVKENYAARGFPSGETRGNPPISPMSFDFRSELRELLLLEYYLEKHTHRTDSTPLSEVFAHAPGRAVEEKSVAAAGTAFDAWIAKQTAQLPPPQGDRDRHQTFSSSYEFALWAKDVRRANAQARGGSSSGDRDILDRLRQLPVYNASQSH